MNTKTDLHSEPGKNSNAVMDEESDTNASAVEDIEPMNPQWLRRRLQESDQPNRPSVERAVRERVISGNDMRLIRERCGYMVEEFAEFLRKEDAPFNSVRLVSRLEQQQQVPLRYVIAFKRMVGPESFQQSLREIVLREEHTIWLRKIMRHRAYVAERRTEQMVADKQPARQPLAPQGRASEPAARPIS